MADKLILDEDRDGYWRLCWWLQEEGEIGAILGQGGEIFTEQDLAKAEDLDEWEHKRASMVASMCEGVERDRAGYFWTSLKEAQIALKLARVALKDRSGRPVPEWAQKALTAGWKPPKGWKP